MDIRTFMTGFETSAVKDPKAPTVFVYHGYCNDGQTALAIAKHYHLNVLKRADDTDVCGVHQRTPEMSAFMDKTVIFLDFCYPIDVMKAILEVAESVTVIDHHVSAYDEMKDFSHEKLTYVYEADKCGAMMIWDICYPDHQYPLFVKCINDRDLWLNILPCSEYMSLALRTEYADKYDFIALVCKVINEWLEEKSENTTFSLFGNGQSYKRYHDVLVAQIKCNAFEVVLDDGQPAMMCYAPMAFASDVGAQLAREFTGVAVIVEKHGDHIKYAMRVAENCDYDASIYAKSKGGGGHKKASGYREFV